jgi:phosphoribosyl-AMP cyclohydrolase
VAVQVPWPNFAKRGGVIVAIAQEKGTGAVLMQGYVDEAAYRETLETGEAVYYSTSRQRRWKKGETSGDVQVVHRVLLDCDGDSVIYEVEQKGRGACHTGARSCFYRDALGRYGEAVQDGEKERLELRDMPVHPRLMA